MCTPRGARHMLIIPQMLVPKVFLHEQIKERVENQFYKRLILGSYVIFTRLLCFNIKTKNVIVLSILFCILFHLTLYSFLLVHFITIRIKYYVWYNVVLIDSLQVIQMKIPFIELVSMSSKIVVF